MRRTVELLLDRRADVNEVHHNDYGAMSVLYGAAGEAHDLDTTRLLLDRGANPDDGESVYHAVEAHDTACLELLLERGATVRDTNALGNAIGDPVKIRVLLEKGDLRPSDPELRNALLHVGDPAVAELLIDHGARARRPRPQRADAVRARRPLQERRDDGAAGGGGGADRARPGGRVDRRCRARRATRAGGARAAALGRRGAAPALGERR
ncbi:MAG: hypothetical protein ACXW08_01120 [Solirubrobacteraceae bacterium]